MRSFSLSPHLGQEHSGLSQNAVPWRRGRTGNMLLACDPEWLIGVGRLVTSLFAVVAMHLDPTQPAAFRHESKVIIGLYVAFRSEERRVGQSVSVRVDPGGCRLLKKK